MKLTEIVIKNLKPKEKEYSVSCDMGTGKKGFTVRVRPNGSKSYWYRYKCDGKTFKLQLGTWPAVTLGKAVEKYDEAWKMLRAGKNPAAAKQLEAEARRKSPTVAELVKDYIERYAQQNKKTWAKDDLCLKNDPVRAWGYRKAASITRLDVNLLLEEIVDRGSPGQSRNVFEVLRRMFNWAVEVGYLEHSPCHMVKQKVKPGMRTRYLTPSEIRVFWNNLDNCAMTDDMRRVFKLILLTGQRPGEVCGMHHREIVEETREIRDAAGKVTRTWKETWWILPTERLKAKKGAEKPPHRVFLTPTALSLIGEGEGYVFTRVKDQPFDANALAYAVRRNLFAPVTDERGKPLFTSDGSPAMKNLLGVEKFTPHDLRRTVATHLAELNFSDEVIDALLCHIKRGVIRRYNIHRYDRQIVQALEAWERKLNSIITGKETKVISMQPRRKKAAPQK